MPAQVAHVAISANPSLLTFHITLPAPAQCVQRVVGMAYFRSRYFAALAAELYGSTG